MFLSLLNSEIIFAREYKRITGAEVEVVKRNELHTFYVLPKRWIVECPFWLA